MQKIKQSLINALEEISFSDVNWITIVYKYRNTRNHLSTWFSLVKSFHLSNKFPEATTRESSEKMCSLIFKKSLKSTFEVVQLSVDFQAKSLQLSYK